MLGASVWHGEQMKANTDMENVCTAWDGVVQMPVMGV